MKKPFLTFLLFLFVLHSSAQHQLGVNVGLVNMLYYDRQITPTIGLEYANAIRPHLHIGGSVFYEQYSDFYKRQSTGHVPDSSTSKSAYWFITPKVRVSLGRREYFSIFASAGPGILLSGESTFIQHNSYTTHGLFPYTTRTVYDWTEDIVDPTFRVGIGISEHIQILKHWSIKLSEEVAASYGSSVLSITAGITYNNKAKVWTKRKKKAKDNRRVIEDSIYR